MTNLDPLEQILTNARPTYSVPFAAATMPPARAIGSTSFGVPTLANQAPPWLGKRNVASGVLGTGMLTPSDRPQFPSSTPAVVWSRLLHLPESPVNPGWQFDQTEDNRRKIEEIWKKSKRIPRDPPDKGKGTETRGTTFANENAPLGTTPAIGAGLVFLTRDNEFTTQLGNCYSTYINYATRTITWKAFKSKPGGGTELGDSGVVTDDDFSHKRRLDNRIPGQTEPSNSPVSPYVSHNCQDPTASVCKVDTPNLEIATAKNIAQAATQSLDLTSVERVCVFAKWIIEAFLLDVCPSYSILLSRTSVTISSWVCFLPGSWAVEGADSMILGEKFELGNEVPDDIKTSFQSDVKDFGGVVGYATE